jgi:hypothetical protein
MRYVRWRLKSLLILVVGLAIVCTGAVKWKRYSELRERIAKYSREEGLLRAEFHRVSQLRSPCGNQRRIAAAHLAVAEERRRQIESCERDLRRIW